MEEFDKDYDNDEGDILIPSAPIKAPTAIGKPSTSSSIPSSSSSLPFFFGSSFQSNDYKENKADDSNNESVLKDPQAWNTIGRGGVGGESIEMGSLNKMIDRLNERLIRLAIECSAKQSVMNSLRNDVHEVQESLKKRLNVLEKRQEELKSNEFYVAGVSQVKVPSVEQGAVGSLQLVPTKRFQNPESLKLYNKVMAALPTVDVSNKIAGYINFFKHQLKVEPEWTYDLNGSTGLWKVTSSVLGVKMGEGEDKRKKTAREFCSKAALQLLNNDPQLVYFFIEQSGIIE